MQLNELAIGYHKTPTGWAWLDEHQKQAWETFSRVGLPHRRVEDWKYSSVRKLAELTLTSELKSHHASVLPVVVPQLNALNVVFINGVFQPELSDLAVLNDEMTCEPIAPLMAKHSDKLKTQLMASRVPDEQVFAHLNMACLQDGLLLTVPKDIQLSCPIHLIYHVDEATKAQALHPRIILKAEENTYLQLIEHTTSNYEQPHWINSVVEVDLAEGAKLNHIQIQHTNAQTFQISGTHIEQAANSVYHNKAISISGGWVRNDLRIAFKGQGACCDLSGLYLTETGQHIDNHTYVDHAVSNCTSEECYKGIVSGKSRAIFNGKVIVKEGTVQTIARQMNNNLLLSENAEVDTKPELEIYADDVVCSHGATVGQLDEEAIFYLRARGIADADARQLLMQGFALEMLHDVESDELKRYLAQALQNKLTQVIAGRN